MSKKIETNQKHMNQDNRVVIEKRLGASVSFRAIGIELGKDPTTIAKEVKSTEYFRDTTSSMKNLTDVLMPGIVIGKTYAVLSCSAGVSAGTVINATSIAWITSPSTIIVP